MVVAGVESGMFETLKRRMGGIHDRVVNRQWTHEDKVRFIRAYRKLDRSMGAVRAFFSGDPWAIMRLLGQRNFTYIRHQQDRSRPVTHDDDVAYVVSPYDGDAVGNLYPPKPRPRKVIEGEPLGPEDYEVGLQVPPAEPDPVLEALWVADEYHRMGGP